MNQLNIKIRERVTTSDTWKIVTVIVGTFEQIISYFIKSKSNTWLISEAVAHVINIYLKYKGCSVTIVPVLLLHATICTPLIQAGFSGGLRRKNVYIRIKNGSIGF